MGKIYCRTKCILLPKKFAIQYLNSVQRYGPKRGFVYSLRSVGHLKSDLNQNLISTSPCMGDFYCKRKLKYVYRFLRYDGNRQTNKQTDRQTHAGENIIPHQKGG